MNAPFVKLALPAGSLQDATLKLMSEAGVECTVSSRSYSVSTEDPSLSVRLLRAQEIARCVESGAADAGITGYDWICETGARVKELAELQFSKRTNGGTKWVLASPEDGPFKTPQDLEGKRIATEAVNLTRAYLLKQGVRAQVEFSWGATESKCPDLADAIVDVSETGSSLKANRLRQIAEVFRSTPRLIANDTALQNCEKRERIVALGLALRSILDAREKMLLAMNVPANRLDQCIELLPALNAPDIISTADAKWLKVETVIERRQYQQLLPKLQARGAQGIIAEELSRVVPSALPDEKLIDGSDVLWADLRLQSRFSINDVDFAKGSGLVPCIAQSELDGSIRMLGYMSREALGKTLATGMLTFFSRKSEKLWTKGETSGNFLRVTDLLLDCDRDTIVARVIPKGPTCHVGTETCFGS
jgi:ATP phosphoribosyltransferase